MKTICIVGGGIVGVSTAFYLSSKLSLLDADVKIIIVEANEIAGSASGKAGGFLARDWHRGKDASLARLSFSLHESLAKEIGAENIGYRRCEAVQVTCPSSISSKMWYDSDGERSVIAEKNTAAQVVPYKLVRDMLKRSKSTSVQIGTVTNVKRVDEDHLEISFATKSTTEKIHANVVLFACGPWTSQVMENCGIKFSTKVLGQKAASILLKANNMKKVPDSMLFLDWRGDPRAGELEVYPRLDGIYVCGCGESPCMVREHPKDVKTTEIATKVLTDCASIVSPKHLKDAEVLRSTACYLPVTNRGIVAGRAEKNIYVATGHSCWGILNGPATGCGMAEIIASDLFNNKTLLDECGKLLLKSFSP